MSRIWITQGITMDVGLGNCTGGDDQNYRQEKEMQKGKTAV